MFNFSRGVAASIMSVLFVMTMSFLPFHQVSANSLIDISEAPSVIQDQYDSPSVMSAQQDQDDSSEMKTTMTRVINFGLSAVGLLSILAIIISVIATPVLLILWIVADGEKSKKKLGIMTLISAGLFPMAIIFMVLVLFLFAGANVALLGDGFSDDMSYDEFLEEYSD